MRRCARSVRIAADNVGGDRIAAEHIAEVEQFRQVAIFSFELDQPALIGPQLRELGLELLVFLADIEQLDVVARTNPVLPWAVRSIAS